ncbi:MAG: hypothetical protein KXJ49_06830 [Vulcanococcus sp.]|uniref:hypothetical protein n=1 Tax=Vulcanococcus sp. TaxID=2856995 RepID=UPI0025F643F0|nr:hypothetical protein [Vulcanococcus sp.]MBW0167193.1 hypothetical protein [Vulcanococcus sp.]
MSPIQELGWSQVVEALKSAPEDAEMAHRYAERCCVLTGKPLQVDPIAKARVLWLGMSRGHALLKQAVEWDQPRIGSRLPPNELDGVRGSLWCFVMAFSGWERAGRAALWDGTQQKGFQQRFLAALFDDATALTPPWSNPHQVPASLKQWLTSSQDESNPLPDFLALSVGQVDFVPWMLGEQHQLHPWAVLSCLRNLVAQGALSPTKAQQWGMVPIYEDGVAVLHILFRRLLAACLVSGEVSGCG